MDGRRIVICERRVFTFSGLGNNASQLIVLERAQDVTGYTEATVQAAVSAITYSGTSAIMRVTATPVQLIGSDPATDFLSLTGIGTATLQTGVSAGHLVPGPVPANFGSHLQIAIFAQQPTTAISLACTISVILTLKR
jgi:hypothetical protein